ncbi:MAG: hydrogenase maturation protease [Candidatus Zixiibacteriota bacterium]
MKPLILCLGNDLLGDDGIGIRAAEKLQTMLDGQADVVATSMHGVALLDLLVGYKRVIIIDAIQMSGFPPGSVIELELGDLRTVQSPSPHYTGLPELILLAEQMQLDFPEEIKIFAVEIDDPYTVGREMSMAVSKSLQKLIPCVMAYIDWWQNGTYHA